MSYYELLTNGIARITGMKANDLLKEIQIARDLRKSTREALHFK